MIPFFVRIVIIGKKIFDFGGRVILDCALSYLWWNSDKVAKERCLLFIKGWVNFLDIPPHLWTVVSLES